MYREVACRVGREAKNISGRVALIGVELKLLFVQAPFNRDDRLLGKVHRSGRGKHFPFTAKDNFHDGTEKVALIHPENPGDLTGR